MQTKDRRFLVVGMAKSGVSSARLLAEEGGIVTINDTKGSDKLGHVLEELQDLPIINKLGVNPMELIEETDALVLSPGVPRTLPFVKAAEERGCEVLGEIELGARFAKAPIVSITGTNGKTTTTALTGEIFKAAGKRTFVLGNIGIPIVQEARSTRAEDIIVAEVAGFQLETTTTFHTHSCAVLNITEDHLDRFKTMENYIASKEMVFNNQTPEDFATLNADDPIVRAMEHKTKARVLFFSRKHEVENGAFVRDGEIIFRLDGAEQRICPAKDLLIPGPHNLENALAAVSAAMAAGAPAEAARRALTTFKGVEHRIEFCGTVDGVRYINDSKGTNPDSTVKAVEAMERDTILLLGGSNKNSDYCPVYEAFGGRIKAVVALGFTRDQILRDARKTGYKNIHVCDGSFQEAVQMARKLAKPDYNVLLSPACASYDMFDDYEQRGRVFKEIVANMEGYSPKDL